MLNGVLRQHLLREGKAREAHLNLDDLRQAEAVFMGNGLQGWSASGWKNTEQTAPA
ncbi:MAG: aminotransferase class IV [Pseudomonadales bacterium]|nr:aminotransferase class IV [Pseudomonadales bacterium]